MDCPKRLISVVPFYGQDTWHASMSPRDEADTALAEDLHLEALKRDPFENFDKPFSSLGNPFEN